MGISQKAKLKYQNQQLSGEATQVTYVLPPQKAKSEPNTQTPLLESSIKFLSQDLKKTLLIAIGIFIFEIIVWWKFK